AASVCSVASSCMSARCSATITPLPTPVPNPSPTGVAADSGRHEGGRPADLRNRTRGAHLRVNERCVHMFQRLHVLNLVERDKDKRQLTAANLTGVHHPMQEVTRNGSTPIPQGGQQPTRRHPRWVPLQHRRGDPPTNSALPLYGTSRSALVGAHHPGLP